MNVLFKAKPYELRYVSKVLKSLETQLGDLYQTTVNMLGARSDEPAKVGALSPLLHRLAELDQAVQIMNRNLTLNTFGAVENQLQAWTREFALTIESDPHPDPHLQWIVTQTIQAFIKAEVELNRKIHVKQKGDGRIGIREVLIQSDLLFQCYQSLFPAERMMVISGRQKGWQIELGAAFDVTGNSSSGHVRSDPRKLGQALIAMSSSNTHLAAWFHSHPGRGLECSCPSGVDVRQHADWLQDYSSRLLSGILVQDGYLRFWGSALEQESIRVLIVGSGIAAVKGENHVYQFVTS